MSCTNENHARNNETFSSKLETPIIFGTRFGVLGASLRYPPKNMVDG